jgi:polyisoprenoid-binding protein YceI
VFVSNREGNFALYIMNPDGSNQRRITSDPVGFHEFPTWSPDGLYLAYASDQAGSFDIYISGVDGSSPQRLTTSDDSETEPSWSPDGRQIAYLQTVDGYYEVYAVPSGGGIPQLIAGSSKGDYYSPRWSPDGRKLAYVLTVFDRAGSRSVIYLRDMLTGSDQIVVSHEDSFVQGISWSTDSDEIVYQIQPLRGNSVLLRLNINDGTSQILTDQSHNSEMPSWTTPVTSPPTLILFRILPELSEVRFSLQHELRGREDLVVGVTNLVAGDIAVDLEHPSQSQLGAITINMRTFTTGNEFRDRAIRGQILQTSLPEYEFSTFIPSQILGLPEQVAIGDKFTIEVTGGFSIAGIMRPLTFSTEIAVESEDFVSGYGVATLLRSDYGLNIPDVPFVANVSDEVKLEIEFVAQRLE